MADAKMSDLAAAASLTGAELMELVQGGVNVRTTTQAVADLASGGGGATRGLAFIDADGTVLRSTPGLIYSVEFTGGAYHVNFVADFFADDELVVCVTPFGGIGTKVFVSIETLNASQLSISFSEVAVPGGTVIGQEAAFYFVVEQL